MEIEMYTISQKKARKRHKCHICGEDILPGCEYVLEKYKDEKMDFRTNHRHIHCDAVLQEYLDRWCCEDYYDEEDVENMIHQEICKRMCDGETQDNCFKDSSCFSCGICLSQLLRPPVLDAAIRSVNENHEGE